MGRALAISLLLSLLAVGSGGTFGSAQSRQKPPPLEEEDPNPRPLRKLPPDPDAPEPPSQPPGLREASGPNELAGEAERTTFPELQQLYRDLAYPHDEVTLKGDAKPKKVVPLSRYLGPESKSDIPVALKIYDQEWKPGFSHVVARKEIEAIRHYEQLALDRTEEMRTGSLPRAERLQAADKVLAAVLRFHLPAPDRRVREGIGWKELGNRLRQQLLAVRQELLAMRVAQHDWERALALAHRLGKIYGDAKVQEEIAREVAKLVEVPLKEQKHGEVHKRLALLEQLPGSAPAAEPIRTRLRQQADTLFREAEANAKKDPGRAGQLMNRAEMLWPRLPGLRDLRWQLGKDHPTLGVGVRELPEFFAPGAAVTDSERWAVELLFESLLKPHDRPGVGQVYEPGLAVTWPRVTPRGRLFQLDRDAYWSSGDRVIEADVRQTLELLASKEWPGYAPEVADFLEAPTSGPDLSQVNVTLRQGLLDPESLMTFKVLPASAHLESPDPVNRQKFAHNPVGSGPFQLPDEKRRQAERQAGAVVFVANSAYRRARKPDMPHIQEIRFFQPLYPVADFKDGRLHLLLDLSPAQVEELKNEKNGLTRTVEVRALRNRRIHFLAVNHRLGALRNEKLRKLLAHSINRTAILDDLFKGELRTACRPLNGPYPPGSWACSPTLPPDPYKPQWVKEARADFEKSNSHATLTLKYPSGDPLVEEACRKIQDQVQQVAGITLELEARAPRQLYDDVEVRHDYQLAYYHHDFPSEMYRVWPLFNPSPEARERGRNFLGYHNDGNLEGLLQETMVHRDFAEVQPRTQLIHKRLYETMPLIPLWQWDTLIAVHQDLQTTHLDPLLVFSDVEKWRLKK
jgi:ABC-type transport system substrate-binding protein